MVAFNGLDPRLRDHAQATVEYAQRLGISPEITSVRRYQAEQAALYKKRQAGRWPFPVAVPGTSAHQYGVAWDSRVKPEHQALWTAVRRAMGWFVPDNDVIHAEYPGWQQYASSLRRTQAGAWW
jgi:D-alanyl-D-alanine carboxypeptidase